MSSLLVERSYIDPWTQVAVNGFTDVLASDVRYLLSDRSTAKVWSAGYLSFALWYVFTLNILKFDIILIVAAAAVFSSSSSFNLIFF